MTSKAARCAFVRSARAEMRRSARDSSLRRGGVARRTTRVSTAALRLNSDRYLSAYRCKPFTSPTFNGTR